MVWIVIMIARVVGIAGTGATAQKQMRTNKMDSYWDNHPLLNMTIEDFKGSLSEFIPEHEALIEELYQDGFTVSETIEDIELEEEKK